MKQTALTALTWLIITCPAYATSFDGSKSRIKVEKLIYADSELSELDEDLTAAYTKALKDVANAASVRRAQKQWLKESNSCADAACVKNAYESRANAIARNIQGIEALYGQWEAGDRAGEATYGMMKISKSKIIWKGSNRVDPRCTVSYKLVPESDAIKFKVDPKRFQPLSPFKSYVLAIFGACALKTTHFRLTLPSNMPGYLDMNVYTKGMNDTGGYSHFYKH